MVEDFLGGVRRIELRPLPRADGLDAETVEVWIETFLGERPVFVNLAQDFFQGA